MNGYALSFSNRQHSTTLATLVTLDHFTLLECRNYFSIYFAWL